MMAPSTPPIQPRATQRNRPTRFPILQASSAADIVSTDEVSGSTAAGDNPRGLTDWAAYGTRIVTSVPACRKTRCAENDQSGRTDRGLLYDSWNLIGRFRHTGFFVIQGRTLDEREQDTTGARGTRLRLAKLELLEWSEWVQTKVYDERPPTCLQYSIVWKVNLNKKLDCKDTEQDLMLALQLHCES
jgi:hypothetical protein